MNQLTLEVIESTEYIDSPNKPEFINWDKAARGHQMAQQAANWIKANPRTFEKLCSILGGITRSDHLRDRVNMACMEHSIKVSDQGYMFAHALFAPLTRYACLKYPQLVGNPVVFAESDVDHSGLVPVPEVGING